MHNKLISSLAGAAFWLAASGVAFAADIAVKAPPPAPAPVYNWTGWYVGVNAGASMGNVKTDFNAAPVTLTTNITNAVPFNTPGFAGSNTEYPDGFMGGGQIGYNWQFSPIWVVGLEADFQGALEKDSNTLTNSFSGPIVASGNPGAAVTGTTFLDYATKIEWFGTARLRAGYVWGNGDVFSYVTGGLAYGKVDLEGTSTVSGTITGCATGCPLAFSTTHAIGHSDVNIGWTLGYGTEGRLAGMPGWTWRVESFYMDLGHLNDTDAATCGGEAAIPCVAHATGGQTSTNTHFTDWILRGGLSYQFH
jgi:outer membrane immunogenic protein